MKEAQIRRAQWLLYTYAFLQFFSWQLTVPLVPIVARNFAASAVEVGFVLGAFGLVPLFFVMPFGTLIDRYGPMAGLRLAGLLQIGSTLAFWFADRTVWLTAGQALMGLANAGISMGCQSVVATLGPEQTRARHFGNYSFVVATAGLLGPAVGGKVGDWLGFAGAFALATLLSAAAFGLSALSWPRLQEEGRGRGAVRAPAGGEESTSGGAAPAGVFSLARYRSLLLVVTINFFLVFAFTVRSTFLVVYLHDMQLSSTTIGLLLSLYSGTAVAVRPFLGRLTSLLGEWPLLTSVSLLLAVGIALVPAVGSSLALLAPLVVLMGIGFGLSTPQTMILVVNAVPVTLRGRALALRQVAHRIAQFASPLGFGALQEVAGVAVGFAVAAAAAVAAALLGLRPSTEQRAARRRRGVAAPS